MDHRNPEVYSRTKILAESAWEVLATAISKGERIPSQTIEKHRVLGAASWSTDFVRELMHRSLVENHREEIQALPEYVAWSDALGQDPSISRHLGHLVGTRFSLLTTSEWDYLSQILARLVAVKRKKMKFDADRFDSLYNDMERYFYAGTLGFRSTSVLRNFVSDVDSIDLGDGLRIRTLSNAELEALLDRMSMGPFGRSWDAAAWRHVMELEFELPKIYGELPREPVPFPNDEAFARLLIALRLFKAGTILRGMTVTNPLLDTPGTVRGMSRGFDNVYLFGKYELPSTEISAFKDFWFEFSKIRFEQRAWLNVAISRFNFAYDRGLLEDKLVDYMIAFEALFFKESDVGENQHKLAVRVARLLRDEYEDRKTIAKEMKDFYQKRSEVVHGKRIRIDTKFTERIENYLRTAIVVLLKSGVSDSHDEIIARLDLG